MENEHNERENKGQMSTEEAGRMGGQRVRELVEEGKEQEAGSNQ